MGFFSKLFGKKNNESKWDEIQEEKESLNLKDPEVRSAYVVSCLEQMADASGELDRVKDEYAQVTSYLTDMEEIEALPKETREDLTTLAKHLHDLKLNHDKLSASKSYMNEREYEKMTLLGDDAVDGIEKLEQEEEYKDKVKSDLARIEKEREAYSYRRAQVDTALENSRGVAMIAIVATVILIVILFMLQMLLKLDVALGYYIAVGVVAVSITIIYLRYADYSKEKRRVDSTINELILLENKVKIRYVNNKNLLDYLYTKYDVDSAEKLRDRYDRFIKEKERRRSYERNEAAYDEETAKFLRILRRLNIKDPDIWLYQYEAIYDSREMVEIRHSLIGRRQKLRKQMEYNEQIAVEASDEIKNLIARFPEDQKSILNLVNRFEQNR